MNQAVMAAATAVKHQIADRPRFAWRALVQKWECVLFLLLVAVMLGNGVMLDYFLDPYNLADSTFNFSEKALMALPMALLILCREIDLSVAGILALSSVALGLAHQVGLPPAMLFVVGIGTGFLCGLVNGTLVTVFRLPAIVVTIGTVSLFRGVASVVLGDQAFTGYPELLTRWGQGYFFEVVPRPFVVLIVFAILFTVLLHATVWGRRMVAIGNSPEAARFSGIAVDRYRLCLFMLSGAMAGLAACLLTGRIGSTRPNIALGWELEVITMVILGGVRVSGGKGSMLGVLLAVLVLGMVNFGMALANIPGIIMTILVGILLLATIVLPQAMSGFRPAPGQRH